MTCLDSKYVSRLKFLCIRVRFDFSSVGKGCLKIVYFYKYLDLCDNYNLDLSRTLEVFQDEYCFDIL